MRLFALALVGASALNLNKPPKGMNSQAVNRIVQLLTKLQGNLADEASSEQTAFDKWSCWSDDTQAGLKKNIGMETDSIQDAFEQITKFAGNLGHQRQSGKDARKNAAAHEKNRLEKEAKYNDHNKAATAEIEEVQSNLITTQQAVIALNEGRGKAGISYIARLSQSSSINQKVTTQLETALKQSTSLLETGSNAFEMVIGRLRTISDEFSSDISTVSTTLAKAHVQWNLDDHRLTLLRTQSENRAIASEAAAAQSESNMNQQKAREAKQQSLMKADEKTLKDLKEETKMRTTNWAARSADRNAENEALQQAKDTLVKASTVGAEEEELTLIGGVGVETLAKTNLLQQPATIGQEIGQDGEFRGFGTLIKEIYRSIDVINLQMKSDENMHTHCKAQQQGNQAAQRENSNVLRQEQNNEENAVAQQEQAVANAQDTTAKLTAAAESMSEATNMHKSELSEMRNNLNVVNEDLALVETALDFIMGYYNKDNKNDGQKKVKYTLLSNADDGDVEKSTDVETNRRESGNLKAEKTFEGGASTRKGAKRAGQSVGMLLKMMTDDMKKHAQDIMDGIAEAQTEFGTYLSDNQEQMSDLNDLKESYNNNEAAAIEDGEAANDAIFASSNMYKDLKYEEDSMNTNCAGIVGKFTELRTSNQKAIQNYRDVIDFLSSGTSNSAQVTADAARRQENIDDKFDDRTRDMEQSRNTFLSQIRSQ